MPQERTTPMPITAENGTVQLVTRQGDTARRVHTALIDRELLVQIRLFTAGSKNEWGGLLIGFEYNTLLLYCLAAFPPQLTQTPTCCTFANRYRAALQTGIFTAGLTDVLTRVDWLHTHPGYGVFLSDIDNTTCATYRLEDPDILAVVYDPTRDALGWFSQPHRPPRAVKQTPLPLPRLIEEAVIAAHAILALTGVTHVFHAGAPQDRRVRTIRAQTLCALSNILQDKLHHTITTPHPQEHSQCSHLRHRSQPS